MEAPKRVPRIISATVSLSRAFRNPDKQSLSELKEAKSIIFKLIGKADVFWSLLAVSEHAFPHDSRAFWELRNALSAVKFEENRVR